MWYLEPPVCHWAGALKPAALTLPETFHLLFWSFLTLFLERALSFFPPSVTLPTLPACSRGIWCQELYLKGSIPGSRSVSHSAALAKGHTWGAGQKQGRALRHGSTFGTGARWPGVRIWVWSPTSHCIISLCAPDFPSVKCSHTCPWLTMSQLQGQLRCLIPSKRNHRGNSSVSNSRRWCCVHVSWVFRDGNVPNSEYSTQRLEPPACLCLVYSQRAKSTFLLCPY